MADAAIDAAWPAWWSADADGSVSARAELHFGVARRLGLDPVSLLDDDATPRFLWREEARFKHLTSEDQNERAGIESFGRAVAAAMDGMIVSPPEDVGGVAAAALRQAILRAGNPWVGLEQLLALCWGVGTPVVHLRVFPWTRKRMAAMTVRIDARSFVMLGKDATFPAPVAFYLAHELGHIALGHVGAGTTLVDLDVGDPTAAGVNDEEERAADAYALELLTGMADIEVLPTDPGVASGGELARTAASAGEALEIEPGTLALCFGYSTGDWASAYASMRRIYSGPNPVWEFVNQTAVGQLRLDDAPPDSAVFLRTVLGLGRE